jgi:hypothetical protein
MTPDDDNLSERAEEAAQTVFESYWAEIFEEEFEPWKKEAVERCFKLAFFEGALFGALGEYRDND